MAVHAGDVGEGAGARAEHGLVVIRQARRATAFDQRQNPVARLDAHRPSRLGRIHGSGFPERRASNDHAPGTRVQVGDVYERDDVDRDVAPHVPRSVLNRDGEDAERGGHVEVAVVFARQQPIADDDEVRVPRAARHDAKRLRVVRRRGESCDVPDAIPDSVVQQTSSLPCARKSKRLDRKAEAL